MKVLNDEQSKKLKVIVENEAKLLELAKKWKQAQNDFIRALEQQNHDITALNASLS